MSSENNCPRFSFVDIQKATDNFDESKLIGKGGFGNVYKGELQVGSTKRLVAVKRLNSNSNQGVREFATEIEMLPKFRHCNLVSLLGFCDDFPELILVYEFMPQGSLADHLYNNLHSSHPLSWEQRLKICIDAAHGLDYLHTGTGISYKVIHRDVKSANILLDENWTAKISDLGLAKLLAASQPFSGVLTDSIRGTRGYIDPTYRKTHKLTRKTDVYAFGVVLLEVLCGIRTWDGGLIPDHTSLNHWAKKHIEMGNIFQIADPSIKAYISPRCLAIFVGITRRCLHDDPKKRPTMSEIVANLELALACQEGTNPSSTIDEEQFLKHFEIHNDYHEDVTKKLDPLTDVGRGLIIEYYRIMEKFKFHKSPKIKNVRKH